MTVPVYRLRLEQTGLARFFTAVYAEVRIDMCFAVFGAPARPARRREGHRHPDLAVILSVALERWRTREIVPLEEIARTEHVIENQR